MEKHLQHGTEKCIEMAQLEHSSSAPAAAAARAEGLPHANLEKAWMPKLWHGLDFFAWMRLLIKNRFGVAWHRVPMAVMVTLFSVGNTCLRALQFLIFHARLRNVEVAQPIFIIGHYRTGTTLLHELLSRDSRFTFPTTYECFSPNHFLISERFVTKYFGFIIPKARLQDNMHQGWQRPQEDESALLNRGAPSPYAHVAFPNNPHPYPGAEDLQGLSPRERARWKQTLQHFLKQVTYLRPRPIVLKSPMHTCRVKTLLEMFPGARFIYTVRDPREVIPSTLKMWRVLYPSQSFQTPTFEGLEEWVNDTFLRMHQAVEQARDAVPPGQFTEVHYEDLVADPPLVLDRLYRELDLGDVAPALPAIRRYLESVQQYQRNRHQLNDEQRRAITQATRPYIERHGYPPS